MPHVANIFILADVYYCVDHLIPREDLIGLLGHTNERGTPAQLLEFSRAHIRAC